MKPVIGISASLSLAGDEKRSFAKSATLQYVPDHYCKFVEMGGGIPVMIPILDDPVKATDIVAHCDGIIVTGGVDVDPSLYNEKNSKSMGVYLPRDKFEIALVNAARQSAKSILGICRGIQILNVSFGGSLYQDIPTEIENVLQHHDWEAGKDAHHSILFTRQSPLSDLFQSEEIQVNSSHHQSLKKIGRGLEILAAAKDGVIEAVCCPSDRFTYGVQWHPERMMHDAKQVELAKWFISQAV
jgi:putative glutamine amidotransferase